VPKHQTYWVLHEGFVGVADDSAKYVTYKHFDDEGTQPEKFSSTGGWLGITDKYWMAAVVPPQNDKYSGTFRAMPFGGTKSYQADYNLPARALAPGQTITVTQRLFAGAKVVDMSITSESTASIWRSTGAGSSSSPSRCSGCSTSSIAISAISVWRSSWRRW
jgi:YidC/Oxa1 family membrane protein insertase